MNRGAKYRILYFLILNTVIICAGPLSAGVVFEIEVKDYTPAQQSFPMGAMGPGGMGANMPGGQMQPNRPAETEPRVFKTQISAQGRDLKIVTTDENGQPNGTMIFHGQKQEMLVLNPADQTYMVMDSNTMESMAQRISQMQSQMQEALKNVPADKRAMVEQMMKQHMPNQTQGGSDPKVEIEKMDEKDTKNDFPCIKYLAKRADKTTHEYWVTEWKNIKGSDEVVKVFEDMSDFYQKMMDSFSKGPGMGGPLQANKSNPMAHIKAFKGIPVMTKEFNQDNSLANESTLKSAKRQTIDPDEFEPPAGYKRRQMMGAP